MQLPYFGDSYDLAKSFLMQCLAPDEPWVIIPMFTDEWSPEQVESFERLLGGRVRLSKVITAQTDREDYFQGALRMGHTFIDPDTGISIENRRSEDWPNFISLEELSNFVLQNSDHMTLVYDQSYSRQSDLIVPRMRKKLARLDARGVTGFGYLGQASFLVMSCDSSVLEQARQNLLNAGIPSCRLVS